MVSAADASAAPSRLASIDRLRGLVMLLMLVDHTREFFFYGQQVADPMDLVRTSPTLVLTRFASHLCAPVFVVLTGLAAWLYGQGRPVAATSAFLLKRGAFLLLLEVTVVSFAWTFALPPATLFLQVIWAIGLSMIALAGLVHLPRGWIAAVGIVIVAGHNLLDAVHIAAGSPGHVLWAVLHDRGSVALGGGIRARTSYPVMPWIGTIALGYAVGPWFGRGASSQRRVRLLMLAAAAMLALFAFLRWSNRYGDPTPWSMQGDALETALGLFNLTKYPPSLDFLLVTLAVGATLLALWDRRPGGVLAVLGAAPLFFYVLHLYVLNLLHAGAGWVIGDPDFDVPSVIWLWILAAVLAPPLWLATRWFGGVKRRSTTWWVRYL